MTAKFITIEGIEGAGKTTALNVIRDFLNQRSIHFCETREPGGTPFGEALRKLLLDDQYKGLSEDAELLSLFAARAEHLHRIIRPALQKGSWVVCDRFTDASFAYQGGGRGLPMQKIARLQKQVQGDLNPDRTLLLDVPVKLGLQRASQRSEPDRIEQESIDFFQRVRDTYLQLAQQQKERFRVIDASQSLLQVEGQLQQALAGLFTDP
ncbi:MAG: dTMP kinase [gamma proteobacterium symbiont of Bathyaustriella thionipta]|nr:dTMP kinase [gamma proteobacterium symbiont of Bathyaustriella thionipta]